LRLIEELKPDLVISDLRFSVAISAELTGTRHIAISNLYWSPYRQLGFDPMPDFVKRQAPTEKRSATAVVNELRTAVGLPLVDGYCSLVTRGSFAAYADPPALIDTVALPDNHVVLGPILWEPRTTRSDWLDGPLLRPFVYVNLGSTGDVRNLSHLVGALAPIAGTVLVATAGRVRVADPPPNVRVYDFVPGGDVCRVADLVVCNGGSGAIYQALREGVPVLGIWSNIDQYLSSRVVQNAGAAYAIEASTVDTDIIAEAATKLLRDGRYRQAAASLSSTVRALDPRDTFPALVRRALDS
jgi:UDP:flavonoid glycosyltransferase YjiC (YdhE family)